MVERGILLPTSGFLLFLHRVVVHLCTDRGESIYLGLSIQLKHSNLFVLLSAGVPSATAEVAVNGVRTTERGCLALQDMAAHTPNHIGISATTNRKLSPRDLRATYNGPLLLKVGCNMYNDIV